MFTELHQYHTMCWTLKPHHYTIVWFDIYDIIEMVGYIGLNYMYFLCERIGYQYGCNEHVKVCIMLDKDLFQGDWLQFLVFLFLSKSLAIPHSVSLVNR